MERSLCCLLLSVHDLPHGGDIKPQPREQGRLIKIKMIIVVRSSNIGADAHISSLSAVGLDFCHQVGGILRAGESGFLYIIGDLRDSRGSGLMNGSSSALLSALEALPMIFVSTEQSNISAAPFTAFIAFFRTSS